MADDVLNVEALMARLELSRSEIYRQVKDGKLKGETVEGVLQVAEAEVVAFEASRQETDETLDEAFVFWEGFFHARIPVEELGETVEENAEEAVEEAKEVTVDEGSEEAVGEGDQDAEESAPSSEERAKALAQQIVTDGMACDVVDIYLDPLHSGDRILYRSEGRLSALGEMAGVLSGLVKKQLKDLGKLEAKEDDGGFMEGIFTQNWQDQDFQIRITVAPTFLGEHIHLHFYAEEGAPELVALGYTPPQAEAMQSLLTGQPGLLIAAGAADPQADRHRLGLANLLADEGRLVVSVEHRLHYRSETLVQVEIAGEDGFARTMKTVLGMRPDVVMFDEVRDESEVDALLEMVWAGAVVVAQVRAAGFVEALLQLIDLGLSKEGLTQALLGGVERRGLRRLCPSCRSAQDVGDEERKLFGDEVKSLYVPQGCDVCGDGFLGWTRRFGVWAVDRVFNEALRTIESPGTPLIEWGEQNQLSWEHAVRSALVDGDIYFEDALSFFSGSLQPSKMEQ